MAKAYEILFMFNYPHPSGDKRKDIFFSRRDAHRVPEIAPADLERYKALGYISEVEVPDEQAERLAHPEMDLALVPEATVAPRIGPAALPFPLGEQGQKLAKRLRADF